MRRRNLAPGGETGSGSTSLGGGTLLDHLSKLDLYPKVQEDVKVRTGSGGVLALATSCLIALLVLSELSVYFSTTTVDRIEVDQSLNERLRINLNITYGALTCAEVELIAMDVAGEHQLNIHGTVHKHRVGSDGRPLGSRFAAELNSKSAGQQRKDDPSLAEDYCGSCYGAQADDAECCNSCDEVKRAYMRKGWNSVDVEADAEQCVRERENPAHASRKGEGCNLEGFLSVNKVAGNFHVALGTSRSVDGRLIHQFIPSQVAKYNTSHRIHHLSFGQEFPGQLNPLDGALKVVNPRESQTAVFQYFIKVVPTTYSGHRGQPAEKYTPVGPGIQPEDGEHTKGHEPHRGQGHDHPSIISALPGTFFVYDLSPFLVHRTEPFSQFLTGLCAIVGGAFTISGLIDSLLFRIGTGGRR